MRICKILIRRTSMRLGRLPWKQRPSGCTGRTNEYPETGSILQIYPRNPVNFLSNNSGFRGKIFPLQPLAPVFLHP